MTTGTSSRRISSGSSTTCKPPQADGSPDPAHSTEADPDVLADYILALLDNAVLPLDEAMLVGKLEDFIAPRIPPAAALHLPHAA